MDVNKCVNDSCIISLKIVNYNYELIIYLTLKISVNINQTICPQEESMITVINVENM